MSSTCKATRLIPVLLQQGLRSHSRASPSMHCHFANTWQPVATLMLLGDQLSMCKRLKLRAHVRSRSKLFLGGGYVVHPSVCKFRVFSCTRTCMLIFCKSVATSVRRSRCCIEGQPRKPFGPDMYGVVSDTTCIKVELSQEAARRFSGRCYPRAPELRVS